MNGIRAALVGVLLVVAAGAGLVAPATASAAALPTVSFSGGLTGAPCPATGLCSKSGLSTSCQYTYTSGGTTVTKSGCLVLFTVNLSSAACYGSGLGVIEFHLYEGTPALPTIGIIPVAAAVAGRNSGQFAGTNGLETVTGGFTAYQCEDGPVSQSFGGTIRLAA